MMQYALSRKEFNKVLENYLDYVALYKLFNNGKITGATPFHVFYWRLKFHVRYDQGELVNRMI